MILQQISMRRGPPQLHIPGLSSPETLCPPSKVAVCPLVSPPCPSLVQGGTPDPSWVLQRSEQQGKGPVAGGLAEEPLGAGDGAPLTAGGGREGKGEREEVVQSGHCLLEGIKGSILSQEKEIGIKSASSACWKWGQDLWLGRGGLGHPSASPEGPAG